jgi:hypothetical protein
VAASSLPFVLCLPLDEGDLWLKAKESWPRASRVFCYPLERPPTRFLPTERVDILECRRRGNAIDLVLARAQKRRSQFAFVQYRGRSLIFWQTPKAMAAARPGLRVPGGGARSDQVYLVDTRERYGFTFAAHSAATERRRLAVGDYAVMRDGDIVAAVERKAFDDFVTSLVDGSLGFAMAELATLPAAAVAVEGTYAMVLRHDYIRAGFLPELIARLQVRYPEVPINFLESRKLAEEWTYRFLSAACANRPQMPLPFDEDRQPGPRA